MVLILLNRKVRGDFGEDESSGINTLRREREKEGMMSSRIVDLKQAARLPAWCVCIVFLLSVSFLSNQKASAWELFSEGMLTPETISPVPSGAYGGAYDGSYFVPDPGRSSGNPAGSTIWIVDGSGSATTFAPTTQDLNTTTVGGIFLPNDPDWDNFAGKYLTVGWEGPANGDHTARINVYNADGTYTTLWSTNGGTPKTPAIAPAGWGTYGGQLIVADGGPDVYAIDSSGVQTFIVATPVDPITERFGLAFAPSGWGSVGGDLLTSRVTDGTIFAVDSSGNEMVFTTIGLDPGTRGLRQMAFSPDGFIPGYGVLLFISVSGSSYGGGTLGDVLAVNSAGNVVASLRTDLGLDKFDPRGLYFTGDGRLLISDASDPIYIAEPSDFQAVPEPSTILLVAAGLMGVGLLRRKT